MGLFRSSPRVYESLKDPRSIADVLADMGVVYFETGDCDLALGHFEKAFNLAEKIEYEMVMANVLNNLGIISAVQDCPDTALLHAQDCLARYWRMGDDYGAGQAYNNLGLIYMEKRKWQTAWDYFEKGLALSHRIENFGLTATLYVNKSDFNLRQSDIVAASHFCEMASRLYYRIEDHRGIAETERIWGLIAASNGSVQKAQKHFETALDLTKKYGTFFGLAEVYREVGGVYRKRGFHRKAHCALRDSLERYERLGAKKRSSKVRRELALLGKRYNRPVSLRSGKD